MKTHDEGDHLVMEDDLTAHPQEVTTQLMIFAINQVFSMKSEKFML
jgi:hypothetical protein